MSVPEADAGSSLRASAAQFFSVWNLAILLAALIVVFSVLKGDTFLTAFTFQSMVNSRSINAMVALAVMIPLASNNFDLSVASILGIAQVLANGLQTQQGLPWQAAFVLCILLGACVGLINGILVTRAKINSFIATLGTGTLLLGLNQWYTGGMQVVGLLPHDFVALVRQDPVHGDSGAGRLRADHRAGLVDRVRLPAARPLSVRHRRQPARGRAHRHLDHDLRHARLRRLGHHRGVRRA